MGVRALESGSYREAITLLDQAIALDPAEDVSGRGERARESRLRQGLRLRFLGRAHLGLGEVANCCRRLEAGLGLLGHRAGPLRPWRAPGALVRAYALMGVSLGFGPFHPLARRYRAMAESALPRAGKAADRAYVRQIGAMYDAGLGRLREARAANEEALEIYTGLGHRRRMDEIRAVHVLAFFARTFPLGRARYHLLAGRWAALRGKPRNALRHWRDGAAAARSCGLDLDGAILDLEIALSRREAEPALERELSTARLKLAAIGAKRWMITRTPSTSS